MSCDKRKMLINGYFPRSFLLPLLQSSGYYLTQGNVLCHTTLALCSLHAVLSNNKQMQKMRDTENSPQQRLKETQPKPNKDQIKMNLNLKEDLLLSFGQTFVSKNSDANHKTNLCKLYHRPNGRVFGNDNSHILLMKNINCSTSH